MRWKPVSPRDAKVSLLACYCRTGVWTKFIRPSWLKKHTRWVYVFTVHLTGHGILLKPLKTLLTSDAKEFSHQVNSQLQSSELRLSTSLCFNQRVEYRLCRDPASVRQISQ